MEMNTSFSTHDLNLASYLLATNHRLHRLEGPPGKSAFVFGDVSPEDVTAFYSGAQVDARQLLGALRDLKGLLAQGVR
jgi:hypothetical protein